MKTTNKIISIVLFLLTCLTIHVEGQTRIENINTSEIYEGIADIVASYRIVMEPGFRATQGSIVHAYIGTDENLPPSNTYQPAEGNLVDINDNPTNWNYIKTTTLREPITDEAQIDRSERMVEIEYFNKMGEHEVALLVKASPNQKDIASNAVKFDIGSRVMKSYLSFESDTDDGHSSNPNTAWDDAQYFHQNQSLEGRDGDSRPFSQNKYDNSPLNRNAGEIGIGSHWQSHRTSLKYKCNEQAIVSWKADASGQFVRFDYPTGSLTCEEFTDEDGQKQMVFYDNMGRKVAIEEIGDDGSTLKTVFVYDEMGHLRCVVPPKATSPSNADLCYFYTYDKKGRIVEKTLPDHGRECCVYDRRNRMVMSQDGNLAANGQWAFSLYDVFGRIVVSGLVSSLLSQEQLQSLFDDHSETDEIWNANGSIYGYSGRSFPSTVPLALNGVQNVNWYDSYGFLNLFAEGYDCPNYPSGQVINYDTRTKGALTGFLEKAIMSDGTIDMVHVNYYDAKSQLLCSVNDNHLGGRTNRFFQYNFNGQVTEQDVSHKATSQEELLIHSRFVYDHVGRPLKEYYKLGDNDEFIAKAYEYNAIGDLLNTYLFSPDDGTTFAQKLKYHYNIRGWMTKINDFNDPQFDLFALRLNYESANPHLPAQARYNGNISQQSVNGRYCTPSGFGFEYDAHGRLSKAQYAEGVEYDCNQGAFDEQYAFDANGNLATLMRKKDGEFIDKLNCSYYNGTNKLRKVSDLSHSAEGYAYNTETYAYDANGNPIYDPEKHISISYTWLNKPENVEFSDDDHIRYSYTSQGTKLRKEVESRASASDLTTDYCGEFMYEDGELACIFTPFGRIVPVPTLMGTQWRYYYSLTDHLGNVRAEFCAHDSGVPELVQQTDYYPFGLALRSDDYGSIRPNRKLYGGKELQDETLAGYTLNWYDFEARMYNPAIGRFLQTDRMQEKYYGTSPYAYCLNNPIICVDPSGDTVHYASDKTKEIVESLLNRKVKVNGRNKQNDNYRASFAKKWKQLNDSETNYTFALNNELAEGNGVVRQSDDGYSIEFSQNQGFRVTNEFGGFSPEYAALFEETYHAVDIDDGVFKIGEQTAMDEARAWQFAANAPGWKEFVKSKIDGTEGYTIAYTVRVMSIGWVAKMLKEGQPNPTFQRHQPEWYQGEIEKYRGEVMNMAYPSLKEGSGYGLSYHENNLNLLANWSFALKDVKLSNPPESLIFGRDGLIHMKSNKEPYTGTVVGNIVCPYGKTGLKKRDFLFYEKFGSYDVLACNAAFYEMGMFRIAFGHYINVDGAISDGKEEGHWQYRYIYGDKDFLIVTANYKDGKLDGLAEFFKEDGRKYQECEFEKGVLKLRIWYNESGEIIYRDTYENGELKKTEQFAKDPRNF